MTRCDTMTICRRKIHINIQCLRQWYKIKFAKTCFSELSFRTGSRTYLSLTTYCSLTAAGLRNGRVDFEGTTTFWRTVVRQYVRETVHHKLCTRDHFTMCAHYFSFKLFHNLRCVIDNPSVWFRIALSWDQCTSVSAANRVHVNPRWWLY